MMEPQSSEVSQEADLERQNSEMLEIFSATNDVCGEISEVREILIDEDANEEYRSKLLREQAIRIAWIYAARKAYDGTDGLQDWLANEERPKSDYDQVITDAYECFEPLAVSLNEQREKLLDELKSATFLVGYEGSGDITAQLADFGSESTEGAEIVAALLSNDFIEQAGVIDASRNDDHVSMVDFIMLLESDPQQIQDIFDSESVKIVNLVLNTSPDKSKEEVMNMIAANFEDWPSSLDQNYLYYLRNALQIDLRMLQRKARMEKPEESVAGIDVGSKNRSKHLHAYNSLIRKNKTETGTDWEVDIDERLEHVISRSGIKVAGLVSSGGHQVMQLEDGFDKLSRTIRKYAKKFRHNPLLTDDVLRMIDFIAHNPKGIGSVEIASQRKTKMRDNSIRQGFKSTLEHRFSPKDVIGLEVSSEGLITRIIYLVVVQDDGKPAIGIKDILHHGGEYDSYNRRAR